MDLSNDSIPIDSSTGISADDESISELTASPAAGTPPSLNDDNTLCENMHHFPKTSINKLISELSASLQQLDYHHHRITTTRNIFCR